MTECLFRCIDKLVVGPMRRSDLPDNIRVSPSSLDVKPNGMGRVCVDMSHPHLPKSEVDLEGSEPTAVNSGIDMQNFPVDMITTKSILERCWMSGPGSYLAKQDWADAYKVMSAFTVPIMIYFYSISQSTQMTTVYKLYNLEAASFKRGASRSAVQAALRCLISQQK